MRYSLLGLALFAIIISTLGCANRPFRSWFRGAPCSTCQPPFSQPIDGNLLGGCNHGTCGNNSCGTGVCADPTTGNGFLGRVFRPQQNNAGTPPVSVPANHFDYAPQIGPSSEFYGNSNAGRLETPPFDPYN